MDNPNRPDPNRTHTEAVDRYYRYASTMGDRYALPIYFRTIEDAREHEQMCLRLIGGLPGQDSMQIEEWVDGEWRLAVPDSGGEQ